jgi:hypothetical protein
MARDRLVSLRSGVRTCRASILCHQLVPVSGDARPYRTNAPPYENGVP